MATDTANPKEAMALNTLTMVVLRTLRFILAVIMELTAENLQTLLPFTKDGLIIFKERENRDELLMTNILN